MKIRLAAGLAVVATTAVLVGGTSNAKAETPGCVGVVTIPGCGSWQTAAGPDLDVFKAVAASGTPIIVFTPSGSDKAQDFTLVSVPITDHPQYGIGANPIGATVAGTYVNIEYTPNGVATVPHLCVSVVTAVTGQADQLRPCAVGALYNEYQTFLQMPQPSDGMAFSFADYLSLTAPAYASVNPGSLYLTDSNHPNGIGRIGHRTRVISWPKETSFTEFQLWSQI